MKYLLCTGLLCLAGLHSFALTISGKVQSVKGAPLSGVSISLLYPSDSTMATFAITNHDGVFEIKDAVDEHYILQAAALGYFTEYQQVQIRPGETNKVLQPILLEPNEQTGNLKEVIISGERIPFRMLGDTVEYNAASYRVKPNAPVEDLLRQLPGIQVDEKGNIKSMGKEVKKVLVDGKDFFGTDPLIATKNLPADAVDKVQTFGKHSDQSEFSGIDDGTRDQTINLMLKEGKRKGYFGEVKGGGGNEDHFDAGAKVFRFRPENQFAALATANNINKFGFSFNDYINLNGGIGSLMNNSGQVNLNDVPVDFGQPVTGKNTSGAIGLNYSMEPRPKNRFNVNYIGTGLAKTQQDQTYLRTYQPSGDDFVTNNAGKSDDKNMSHNLAMKWNNQIGQRDQLIFQLSGQMKGNNNDDHSYSASAIGNDTINRLNGTSINKGTTAKLASAASWSHKLRDTSWKMLQTAASFSYQKDHSDYNWDNTTYYPDNGNSISTSLFQNNRTETMMAGWNASVTRRLLKNIYIEPGLGLGYEYRSLAREQGNVLPTPELIDSMSPGINNRIYTAGPRLNIQRSSTKEQWNAGVEARALWTDPSMNPLVHNRANYQYLLPAAFWRRELGSGRSAEFSYSTSIRVPALNELLPVWYFSSPLSGIRGDITLQPEYHHSMGLKFQHFDQFEMSTLFVTINGEYVRNKINTAMTIMPDLSQRAQWINTDHASNFYMTGSYSRPLRPLRLEISAEINESLGITQNPVNEVLNTCTTYSHQLGLSFSNHKHKDKWNVRLGGNIQISDARYDLNKEFNNLFSTYTASGYADWKLQKNWFFSADAKLRYYTARSFSQDIFVPLISMELTRYILPLQRGALTLKIFDLLNENRSVIRQGFSNRLAEQTSNVLQRYLMLTFVYKLNKVGNNG